MVSSRRPLAPPGGPVSRLRPRVPSNFEINFQGTPNPLEDCEVLRHQSRAPGRRGTQAGGQARSSSTTRPSTRVRGQVGDPDGSTPDDHNTVVAEVTGSTPRFRVCGPPGRCEATDPRRRKMTPSSTPHPQSTMRINRPHLCTRTQRSAGKHVKQQDRWLRRIICGFDFSHFTGVETRVAGHRRHDQTRKSCATRNRTITDVPIERAIKQVHAMPLFGKVRRQGRL